MSGRIKDEDVAYIRDRAPIDEVVADYVQLKMLAEVRKKVYVLFMMKISFISCNAKQGILSLLSVAKPVEMSSHF